MKLTVMQHADAEGLGVIQDWSISIQSKLSLTGLIKAIRLRN